MSAKNVKYVIKFESGYFQEISPGCYTITKERAEASVMSRPAAELTLLLLDNYPDAQIVPSA